MKAFKYRIYPNKSQIDLLERTFGCSRFVWNTLLSKNKEQYDIYTTTKDKKYRPLVSMSSLSKALTLLKLDPGYVWLNDVSAVVLQQKVKDLAEAFSNSFKVKDKGLPKFKSKRDNYASIRVVNDWVIRIKNNKLYIPKDDIGISVKWDRVLPSKPTSYTISKTPNGKYWVSFLCKEYDPKLTYGQGNLGIDLGLKDLVVDSEGGRYENPEFYTKALKSLAKRQRKLSRKLEYHKRRIKTLKASGVELTPELLIKSNRYDKQRLALARGHAKVANARKDYIHKLTRKLVNENQVIGIESLNVRGMSSNHRLAKSVMDSGLRMFQEFLVYKAVESQWATIVKLGMWYPSTQTCNNCKYRLTGENKLKLHTRVWHCPKCNTEHDRDINAALNIRDVAIRMATITQSPRGKLILADTLEELHVPFKPAAPGFAQ